MNDQAEALQLQQEILNRMNQIGDIVCKMQGVRSKPIFGGQFNSGKFRIASISFVMGGLHRVDYMVMEETSGAVLSVGETKAHALSVARNVLRLFPATELAVYFERRRIAIDAEERASLRKRTEQAEQECATRRSRQARVKSMPRRRKQIFDASEGKCHYCGVALTLDGKWHVEHKIPKALQGDSAPSNLVASCVTCNHEKRDLTDQEYLAKKAKRTKA